MSSYVTVLRGILSDGTVSFYAVFAKAFKSIPAGVFLSQSYFWQENRKYKSEKIHLEIDGKPFFTKTAKDWFDETGLSVDQQQKVRSMLCSSGVLEERLVGNPAKMYYHINFEALVSSINNYLESGVSASTDRRGKNVFKSQTKRGKAKKRIGNKPILSLGLNPKLESDLNPSLESDLNPSSPILESLDSFESEGEENTPTPETSNLQSQKKDVGRSHAENNEVWAKITDPKLPGVTVFDGIKPKFQAATPEQWKGAGKDIRPIISAKTTIEAEQMIANWITGEGIETVKSRFNVAKQRFDPAKADELALHYCSVYTKNPANKERLLKDPITHFSDGLFSYLKNEESFGRDRQPGNPGATRNGNQQNQTAYTAPKSVFKAPTI